MKHVQLYEQFNGSDALNKLADLPRKGTEDYSEFGEDMSASTILPTHPVITYDEMMYLSMYLNDHPGDYGTFSENVPLAKLYSGQHELFSDKVAEYITQPGATNPTVFLYRGDFIMVDGHHRAAAQVLAGNTSILCDVIRYSILRPLMDRFNQQLYGATEWKKRSAKFGNFIR